MKERDTAADAQSLHLIAWCVILAGIGAAVGILVGGVTGGSGAVIALGAVIGGGGGLAVVLGLSSSAAATAGAFLSPSGRTTPGAPEFSLAESLAARGLLAEASVEYRAQCDARPGDPHPCIRLARLYRDRLADHAQAGLWFTEARRRAADPALEHLIVNEIVELYVRHMNEPARALPELARFAHAYSGTPQGERAAAEVTRIKREHLPSGT